MNTLLLDNTLWDLVLDSNGNIALASSPYAVAQDVASACRTFLGEVWYDSTLGVPYEQQFLGYPRTAARLASALISAASTVPEVSNPVAVITGFDSQSRTVHGQISFAVSDQQNVTVNF